MVSAGGGGVPAWPEPDTDPTGSDWDGEPTALTGAMSAGAFFGDRFRIGNSLGSGAMGRVVAAIDLTTHAEVALKVLHKDRARDLEAISRLEREAEILGSIGHPGIVRVVAIGRAPDGTPWLAMELLRGETLKARIRRGPIDAHEALPILVTICDALAAAHHAGVVHRDLKPENVILLASGPSASGSVPPCKILDFGLSRFTASKTLTRTGTVLGTPRYMAPEQVRSAASSTYRVDVYAVGVLLYEMLSGRSPYPAEDLGQLLGCVLEGRTIPLAQVRPDLPPAIGAVIARAMAREPEARFETAGAIAEAYAGAIGVRSGRSKLAGGTALPALALPDEGTQPLLDPFALAAAKSPSAPLDPLESSEAPSPRSDPSSAGSASASLDPLASSEAPSPRSDPSSAGSASAPLDRLAISAGSSPRSDPSSAGSAGAPPDPLAISIPRSPMRDTSAAGSPSLPLDPLPVSAASGPPREVSAAAPASSARDPLSVSAASSPPREASAAARASSAGDPLSVSATSSPPLASAAARASSSRDPVSVSAASSPPREASAATRASSSRDPLSVAGASSPPRDASAAAPASPLLAISPAPNPLNDVSALAPPSPSPDPLASAHESLESDPLARVYEPAPRSLAASAPEPRSRRISGSGVLPGSQPQFTRPRTSTPAPVAPRALAQSRSPAIGCAIFLVALAIVAVIAAAGGWTLRRMSEGAFGGTPIGGSP